MSADGIVLFSGGLDSLLAAKLLQKQGLDVLCLHFTSPFFGSRKGPARWKRLYDLDVEVADAGAQMVELVSDWPPHGFGKVMNPCVDCKIALLRLAKRRMEEEGAKFLATGEVIGQRPMSQRRDVMNVIRHAADVDDILLRPLCARHLDPTPCELSGLVDRSQLLGMHGRGRQEQLELAREYGFTEIPSPGGGCLLTERENARHYWPLRKHRHGATPDDYRLANCGRQMWHVDGDDACWMIVARNNRDNDRLRNFATGHDLVAGLCDFPGPIALLRDGAKWSAEALKKAAAQFVSYAPRAMQAHEADPAKEIRVWLKNPDRGQDTVSVLPHPERVFFQRPSWEEVKAEKHDIASRKEAEKKARLDAERAARKRAREETGQAGLTAGTAGTAQDDL